MYLTMWRIRAFDERAMELYREGVMRGTTHPYIGMEAVAVQEAAFDYLDAPILRVGGRWAPVAYNARLKSAVIPRGPELKAAVLRSLNLL